MKIAIDARWIFEKISGIGLYTQELIRALARLDSSNEYVLLFCDDELRERTCNELSIPDFSNFSTAMLPYGVLSMKSQLSMPGWLRKLKAGVFHSTSYMIPLRAFPCRRRGKTACVVTIHDVIPLLFDDHAPHSKKSKVMPLYRFVNKQAATRADRVLTVSENSAKDIRRILLPREQDHDKVVPVYNGVSETFAEIEWSPAHEPRELLYVGRFDPYKNVTGLIRIFAEVKKTCSENIKLVLAGEPDPNYPEPMDLAKSLKVDDSIEFTGYLDEASLHRVYSRASALVYPSRYEGFGLPVLEAMAAGIPVVCSGAGSLAEVAGDAAAVHDCDDVQGFAESICGILNSTARAKDLSRLGRTRAAEFTWERTAAQTLSVYAAAAGAK